MFGKRKQAQELGLQSRRNRINELEEIICPNQQHEWVFVDSKDTFDERGYYDRTIIRYQCKNCKKQMNYSA